MIRAFAKAFGQLSDPALRRYLWISVVASLAVFLILWGAAIFGLILLDLPSVSLNLIWWQPELPLEGLTTLIGAVLVFVLLGLMFPSLLIVIIGFFLEDIAQIVEDRHYPALGLGRDQTVTEVIRIVVKFAVLAIVLNLAALPVFLLLMIVPPFNLFVFYALNGYLLGREYYELVAYRRLPPVPAQRLRRVVAAKLFLVGVVIAVLMSVPVLNLIVPIVATAAMVHLVQDWRARYAGGQ